MSQIKISLLFLFLSLNALRTLLAQPNEFLDHLDSFQQHFYRANYAKSKMYGQLCVASRFARPEDFFMLAKCQILIGEIPAAFETLDTLVGLNIQDYGTEFCRNHSVLQKLYSYDQWPAFLNKLESLEKRKKDERDTSYQTALLQRRVLDQKYRSPKHGLNGTSKLQRVLDSLNQHWLDSMILVKGWPKMHVVGTEAVDAAWLIAQHADDQPEFQTRCLNEIQSHFRSGDVRMSNYAYLFDRVAVNNCAEQLYGTQFSSIQDEWNCAKSIEFKPISNSGHVDKRRAYMHMGTLEEYRKYALERYRN